MVAAGRVVELRLEETIFKELLGMFGMCVLFSTK